MYKQSDGSYVHGPFLISRGSYLDTPDDRLDRWYVDLKDSAILDRRGAGFRTLAAARACIDEQRAADLRCPHCDLWIGDPDPAWAGMPWVNHDIDECNEQQELAR